MEFGLEGMLLWFDRGEPLVQVLHATSWSDTDGFSARHHAAVVMALFEMIRCSWSWMRWCYCSALQLLLDERWASRFIVFDRREGLRLLVVVVRWWSRIREVLFRFILYFTTLPKYICAWLPEAALTVDSLKWFSLIKLLLDFETVRSRTEWDHIQIFFGTLDLQRRFLDYY